MSISNSSLLKDISEEILLRSPVKSLLRFKSVSKSFYSLISSLNFVNKHMNHNIQENNIILIYPDCPMNLRTTQFISLKLSLLFPSTECRHGEVSPEFTDCSFIYSGWRIDSFCGSYDVLLCICYVRTDVDCNKDEQIVVLNPSTTDFKEIRVPTKLTGKGKIKLRSLFWFGYDYKIADYKLVRVVGLDSRGKENFEVEVYTLGLDSWRKIDEHVSYKFEKHQPGVLVNGALHWFVVSNVKRVKVLVSFDISNERFVELPLPKERLTYPEEPLEDAKYQRKVGELGGCICLLFPVFGDRVDVWIMQEYGVWESWTKSFTIKRETITRALYLSLK